MEHRIFPKPIIDIVSPEPYPRQSFTDPVAAVQALKSLYDRNTAFLRDSFVKLAESGQQNVRFRAFYPEVGISTSSYAQVDTRVSFGHVPSPGQYATTITRPDLFERYLVEQLRLIIRNHGVPIEVAESSTRKDREIKARLYAECGVTEYWLVDLKAGLVEVFRDASDGVYRTTRACRRGETIAMAQFPDVSIAVADILPPEPRTSGNVK